MAAATANGLSLDTNLLGDRSAELTLSGETLITMYLVDKSGSHHNHRVIFEVSPDDGATWIPCPPAILGLGVLASQIAATKVRACVSEAEGGASEAYIWILAR